MKILVANMPAKSDLGGGWEKVYVRAGSRWPFSYRRKKGTSGSYYIPFPFFLAYTAAFLEEDGHEVVAIDSLPLDLSEDEFLQQVRRTEPEAIVAETSTPTFEQDMALIRRIKEMLRTVVILTGTHATTFAEEIIARYHQVDYVVAGEYEVKVRDLIRSLDQSSKVKTDLLPDVAGRKEEKIFFRRANNVLKDLTQLPFPARHLFPGPENKNIDLYWDNVCQLRPCLQLHSSRGCSFRCNFCLWNQSFYSESGYRRIPASRVVDEIELLIEGYRPAAFYFDDDSFTLERDHVVAICSEIRDRGLKIKWSCMGDVWGLNRQLLALMAEAGCIGIKFGIETGSTALLRRVQKKVPLTKIEELTKEAALLGIRTHATFCLGLSGETKETLNETFSFASNLDVDSVQCSICVPYPGTKFYQEARAAGLLLSEKWEDYDGRKSIVRIEGISPSGLELSRRRLIRHWLKYRLRSLNWIFRQVSFVSRLIKNQGLRATIRWLKALWAAV